MLEEWLGSMSKEAVRICLDVIGTNRFDLSTCRTTGSAYLNKTLWIHYEHPNHQHLHV